MLIEISVREKTTTRQDLFETLYKSAFPAVAKYISKRGGTFDEAKDVFQDALVVFYEKTYLGKNEIQVSAEAYIFGITKHLWIRRSRKKTLVTDLDAMGDDIGIEKDDVRPDTNRLLYILELTGKKCMDLLSAFYYDQLPLEKIKNLFGYATLRSATVQKFKCLEKFGIK